eukprot:TRINITY_DN1760_c0_g1_i1.p1 TRINITY_DN1760_c0_g1~~TRINITY_DN1760_c0_g1_i1.p1  ORF type:complete len:142 (+),score=46.12 TRINITY_DN1760_c0_g1_i1:128-553(+)
MSLQVPLQSVDDMIIAETNLEIESLARDAAAVRDMMKDMGDMIQDQGVALQKVEDNVDTTDTNVYQGVSDIQEASGYQCSARKKQFCIAILVLLIITGVVLGILGGLGYLKAPPPPPPSVPPPVVPPSTPTPSPVPAPSSG